MKTPDEIKKALTCCATFDRCLIECPYADQPHIADLCTSQMAKDAAAYIIQMEERIAQLEEQTALKRKLKEPLTLKELNALIDTGEEVVVYFETKYDSQTYATIICCWKMFDRYGKTPGIKHMRFERYGKTWRAWAARPTKEERAAALWEV